jgi:hypothetical protein
MREFNDWKEDQRSYDQPWRDCPRKGTFEEPQQREPGQDVQHNDQQFHGQQGGPEYGLQRNQEKRE